MDGYQPPTYARLIMPTIFDAAEAHRRREAYEEYRRERAKLWHQAEQENNPQYYQREAAP